MASERLSWDELSEDSKSDYEGVALEPGETMADWWEVYMDAIEEDGSWEQEGWPGSR